MRKHGGALLRDRSGVTIIEFAFVAAPLAALLFAILQTSLTFLVQQTLETVSEASVRSLMTGQAQQNNMTADQFKTLACSKLPSFMNCANLTIDVEQATTFSAANTSTPTITYKNGQPVIPSAYTPGGSGAINVAKFMYIWHEQKGPLGFDLSTLTTGDRLLMATAVFKTEPYIG
jgi:Flp pilus assembly protein TadG